MQLETDDVSAIRLTIDGMSCDHCRKTVEGALMGVSGVWAVEVDLRSGLADVHCDASRVRVGELTEAVRSAGYSAEVLS